MKEIIISFILLASNSGVFARTWTNADGSKTFEGELQSYDSENGSVSVLVAGKPLTFNTDKLSEDDLSYLKDWEAEANAPKPEELLAEQKIGQQLTKRVLSRLNGKRFKSASLEKAPQYYLLYFSASW